MKPKRNPEKKDSTSYTLLCPKEIWRAFKSNLRKDETINNKIVELIKAYIQSR